MILRYDAYRIVTTRLNPLEYRTDKTGQAHHPTGRGQDWYKDIEGTGTISGKERARG
jgi:hypothetical protein